MMYLMFDNETFIEQLLIKADPEIDDEALDLMVEDVKPVLIDWITTHLAKKLTDTQLQEFMKLIKKWASGDEIQIYLDNELPDYEEFINKVYDDFENMYLDNYTSFAKETAKHK